MLKQDFFNLQRVRLNAPQEWALKGECLSFLFPEAGGGKWIAGAVSQRLGPGDVLVLNADLGGKVCVAGPGEMNFCSFSLNLEHMFPLFESSEITGLQNVLETFRTAKWYPAGSAVAQECHRRLAKLPAQVNVDYRSHLLLVAAAVLTEEFGKAKNDRVGYGSPEEHLVQVFKKLTTSEMLSLSVGELAHKFGCSRRHLNRLFHQYFGISVATLRMEMRLLKSVSLLRDPDAKVIRVAEDCGFNQLGLFNTCFKRRFGTSPGKWRKLNLKSGGSSKPLSHGVPKPHESDACGCPLQINGLCPLSGTVTDSTTARPYQAALPKKADPASLSISPTSRKKREEVEPVAASNHKLISTASQRRVAVRISA